MWLGEHNFRKTTLKAVYIAFCDDQVIMAKAEDDVCYMTQK